ncbi:MAG: LamG-like jellyroll fold domain-containing protein [bacterium]
MLGRIVQNSINVDFDKGWNFFRPGHLEDGIITRAASGTLRSLSFSELDTIRIGQRLQNPTVFEQIRKMWENARGGKTSLTLVRDRNLGGYWGFERQSLKNNDGTDGTFTRTNVNDSAWYLDRSTGYYAAVDTADTARFPEGKYGDGVLIEGTRTNLNTRPSDFDPATSSWVASNITVSADATETKDPAGTNIADKLTASAINGTLTYTTGTAVGTDDGVFSLFMKSPSGNVNVTIKIRDSVDGDLGSNAVTVTPTWQRFQVAHESVGATTANWEMRILIPGNGDIVYAWCGQLEVGTNVLFASNPIGVTSTSSVTRNAEKLTYSTTNIVNLEKGTIGMWIKFQYGIGDGEGCNIFQIGDGTNQSILLQWLSNDAFLLRVVDSLGTNHDASTTLTTQIQANTWHHILATWDVTDATTNTTAAYIDAVKILGGLSPTGAFIPKNLNTTIALGCAFDSTNQIYGIIDEVFVRKNVLNATEINKIYNQGRALAEMRNRWTAIWTDVNFTEQIANGVNRYNFEAEFLEVV